MLGTEDVGKTQPLTQGTHTDNDNTVVLAALASGGEREGQRTWTDPAFLVPVFLGCATKGRSLSLFLHLQDGGTYAHLPPSSQVRGVSGCTVGFVGVEGARCVHAPASTRAPAPLTWEVLSR